MKNIVDFIKENLQNHLCIECYTHHFIYEKYGIIEETKELSKELINRIKEKINKKQKDQIIIINDLENYFCNLIILNIKIKNDNIIQCKYTVNESKFYVCKIDIDLPIKISNIPFEKLKGQIMHELLHAYEDYVKFNKEISNEPEISYKESAEFIKRLNKISIKYKNNENLFKIESYLKELFNKELEKLFYYLDVHEINAYFQELYSILDSHKDEIKKLDYLKDDIYTYSLNIIKETNIYKTYIDLITFIEFINPSDKTFNDILLNIIKENYEIFSNYSNEKIKKILNKRLKRLEKKFYRQLPNMIIEYIKENISKYYL